MNKEYIKKEIALNECDRMLESGLKDTHTRTTLQWCKAMLTAIGSTDVKPVVKGKWITHYCAANGHSDIYCSVCNKDATYFVGSSDGIHWSEEYPAYCPNCGADMREEIKNG